MQKKPWSGRFSRETEDEVEEFTESISVDKRLYKYDIEGSKAHARMLHRIGVLNRRELNLLLKGLEEIRKEIESGKFLFTVELEDIHMNIERRLIEKIGPVGEKLHTGRSRNDQVVLDMRLYMRDVIHDMAEKISNLQDALIEKARAHMDVIMPGFTHLQHAQPIIFSHHLLAYWEMLDRDKERLEDSLKRVNILPLGSGALAGTSYNIDRRYLARVLGFEKISANSMDAVSDRDFILEFLSHCAILAMHLSRFSEDLIIWSSQEFSFIELPDEFCTGSSMMPQKKNPDILELIRGKSGRLYGNLVALLTTMKGLPLSYNRDMQEDKMPLFDTVDTIGSILDLFPSIIRGMIVNKENMMAAAYKGYMWATDMADYLVRKGVPFRSAHEITGRIVSHCIELGKDVYDLRLSELKGFSEKFDRDIYRILKPEKSVELRNIYGGTGKRAILKRLREIERNRK